MDCCGLTVTASEFDQGRIHWPEPLAIVDLDAAPHDLDPVILPPVPVVGRGDCGHPLAAQLDTLVEIGFNAQMIIAAVREQPLAAATLVQLLRVLPSLSAQEGLVVESLAYASLQASTAHRDWIARQQRPSSGAVAGKVAGKVGLIRDRDIVTATLNRAQAGNAIDRPMRDALHEAFALVNADPTIARIVLRGKGKAFSLGADLGEFGTTTDPAMAHMIRSRTLPAHEAVHCADRFVAEIDGACVGAGLELAAFASRITATRRSWFQLPELAMGVLPGAGGCVSLSRRIGRQRTALMVLTGRRISAARALEWGLIDELVD